MPSKFRFGPLRIMMRIAVPFHMSLLGYGLRTNPAPSSPEPFCRHGNRRGEEHHQEQDDELCDHEWPYAFDNVFHADAGYAADDVEDDADRRGNQSDGVVDDEEDAEIHGVDAGLLDDRHQDRREDQDRRRHVERRADNDDQDHDREHQQGLVAHEGAHQVDHLIGDFGDSDEPGGHQCSRYQEHDHAGA